MDAYCKHKYGEPPNRTQSGSYCVLCNKYSIESFGDFDKTLTFHFPTKDLADEFKTWLCDGGGDQQFDYDDNLHLDFDYHQGANIIVTQFEEEE